MNTLLPYQKRWIADESDVKIIEKSRRVGITWVEASLAVLTASAHAGKDVYYISYNMEFTKEFVRTCAGWAKTLNQAASALEEVILKDGDDDITAYRISFPSGFKIMGLPGRATTLRGRQGVVIIDEAAFCENLKDIIKAAMALLMWGGQVRIISTHNGEDNYYNEIIKDTRAGRYPYSLHRVTLDDALRDGLYERISLLKKEAYSKEKEAEWRAELIKTYGDGAEEELFCIPSKTGSRYFPRALIESCMEDGIPVFPFSVPDEFTFFPDSRREKEIENWLFDEVAPILPKESSGNIYIGMDFARSGDLSEILITIEQENLIIKTVALLELRNIPFSQQFQILKYLAFEIPGFSSMALDARGNGQMLAEMMAQELGPVYVHQVMLSLGFYAEYFPKLKGRFEDKQFILPKSLELIEDFRTVGLKKGVPVILEHTGSTSRRTRRHGDSVIATLLNLYAVLNDEGGQREYAYEGISSGNSFRQEKRL